MNDLREHKPIPASERDRLSPVWDMSQERAFIENLLCNRLNYFLIFFSLTVAGFSGARNPYFGELILILGAVITTMFARVLSWNERKLNSIIGDLHKDESHPATIIDGMSGKSRRNIMGLYIPRICSWTIIIGAIVNFIYLLNFIKL